jgi:hypothetical protein
VLDDTPQWAFATDTAYYLDSASGSIGITPMDGVHSSVLSIDNQLDKKQFQNGSNTRFQLAGYSRGPRVIELRITAAKTAGWVAEKATHDDSVRVNRWLKVSTTSTELAAVGIPFRYDRLMAARLFDVTDTEVNNNAALEFTYRAYYDSAGVGYSFRSVLVNQLTALP